MAEVSVLAELVEVVLGNSAIDAVLCELAACQAFVDVMRGQLVKSIGFKSTEFSNIQHVKRDKV